MVLLVASHCYLGDEKRSGAFVLYPFSVIAAAGSLEGNLSSGMLVFGLPA